MLTLSVSAYIGQRHGRTLSMFESVLLSREGGVYVSLWEIHRFVLIYLDELSVSAVWSDDAEA
jgi:hypothetical protein